MDLEGGYSTLVTVKEEKIDEDEIADEEKKYEPNLPKRGRARSLSKKSSTEKVDVKAKLERSRQSARECRARKKLRYQYLEEVISETEKAIFALRRELDTLKLWAKEFDEGRLPENLVKYRTSCVEKKLTAPFTLQSHHQAQMAQAKLHSGILASQLSQSPTSTTLLGSGGGICMSPTSSSSLGLSGLSLSPSTGQLGTSYMTLDRFKRSPTNLSPTSASSNHSSISPS